ncbi:DUF5677 domain-containing protein [Candidatus Electronema sp. JC]|uniref:DUF5677 domain-containing protein n=1 Tax=Candidatus Electronema sp. JC TaxID=3401570 RepID=UPI003B4315D4
MFGIQEKIEKQLQIQLEPSEFLLKIIRNKLADLGVRLNRLQLKTLRCQLKETNPAITFDLTDLQVARAKIKSRSELEKAVELVLSEIFSEAFQKIDKIKDRLPDIMLNLAEHAGEFFFRQIRRTYRYGLNNRREHQAFFEKDILSIWGRAITQLEVLLILSIESIGYIDKMFHAEKTVYSETKWIVLNRLHGRACQITGEIICLLKSGYADGAEARWRSLHELSVVSAFIFDHDDYVADQYVQHHIIEEYKEILQQQSCYPELNEDIEFCGYKSEVERKRVELIEKYGKHFGEDYGWAFPVLGGKKPSFRQIEEYVNLSSVRYAYRKASHNIHAGVRGTFLRLGLHPQSQSEIILAGASDYGLEKPGSCAAASLLLSTVTLLHGVELIDAAVFMKIIAKQAEITRKEFRRAHRSMAQSNLY